MRLRNGKSAYVVHLSMEQARMLAVEMHGLASSHCPLHHMALQVAEVLGANISHVVIRRVGDGDEVAGDLRLVTQSELRSVSVDAAAGLSLAIHLRLPVFMDGDFASAGTDDAAQSQSSAELGETMGSRESDYTDEALTPIPRAFQDVIDGLAPPEGD